MIGRSSIFIELSNKDIVFWRYNGLKIGNKVSIEKVIDTIASFENFNMITNNCNYYIILTEGEVLIKSMILPKSNKAELKNLVRNELIYLYRSADEILYTYVKKEERKNTEEILVYCLNSKDFNLIHENQRISLRSKGVFSIQFLFFRYFSKRIKDEDYLLAFCHNRVLYFIACVKGNFLANYVIRDYDLTCFQKYIENFVNKYDLSEISEYKIDKIYMINLFMGINTDDIMMTPRYRYEDFGTVKTSDIFCEVLCKHKRKK